MALKDASRVTRLQWFARQVIDATWHGLDVGGDEIQSWAKSAGLIDEHDVTDDDIKALADDAGPLATIEMGGDMSPGDTYFTFSSDTASEAVNWNELKSQS